MNAKITRLKRCLLIYEISRAICKARGSMKLFLQNNFLFCRQESRFKNQESKIKAKCSAVASIAIG
jgi:hypothetical protein